MGFLPEEIASQFFICQKSQDWEYLESIPSEKF
jgi:hypothetical protein